MKIRQLLLLVSATLWMPVMAQQSKINYEVEAQAIGTTNEVVPFWMRSNEFGSIPSHGVSGSFIGRAHKDYDHDKEGIFDWGAGFEGRANAGNNSKLLLIEGYAKVKAGIFQLKAGRTKDVMGLNGDSSLTSGNFAVSGNALGIPKLEIAIPDYYTIPVFDGLISVKGSFSHGWLGSVEIDSIIGYTRSETPIYTESTSARTYFHQKSFYGRLGKPDWRVKFYGGFNHQVFWGNERKIYGPNFELSNLESMFYVLLGKAYGNEGVPRSKIGNQLGSIDLGLELDLGDVSLLAYRQNFYDIGALAKLANIKDGLNGITLTNLSTKRSSTSFRWDKILFELLYSKHQAGEFGSKKTKSGDENYYNNYFYPQGWSYNHIGLGTPFISSIKHTRAGLPSIASNYFINNRVIAFHSGFEGSISDWQIQLKLSYSSNYGTFGTSPEGHSMGEIKQDDNNKVLFGKLNQFSSLISVKRHLKNGLRVGALFALDEGQLLYNSKGVNVSLAKSF